MGDAPAPLGAGAQGVVDVQEEEALALRLAAPIRGALGEEAVRAMDVPAGANLARVETRSYRR